MPKVILLVGFSDPLRTDMIDVLTERDYLVDETQTIATTYLWLKNNELPYCIVCDNYHLAINETRRGDPMDGYGFLLKLNKHPSYCDIHFGLIGRYDDHPYERKLAKPMLPAQLCFWLHKLFTIEELIDGIENCSGHTPYGTAPQAAWKSTSPMLKLWKNFAYDEETSD